MQRGLGIDAPTWSRVSPLLDQALDLPEQDRAAWLDSLPAHHCDLKEALRDLLSRAAGGKADDLLGILYKFDPVDDTAATGTPARVATHAAGDTIGPYRLVRELGAGGMGVVWLANRADGLMQRRVALKLPHGPFRGGLAARITREREIIATLDHPHIARLYDAGVAADGQPYLALEVVEGQRIDRYCDERQLGVAERLRLFVQAAQAVSHAHGQLVVHRDIKPSNLMVDAHGQVKLLDFGIAKLLEDGLGDAPELTQQGMRVLTPDYASPEQIAGLAISTRSDVYSLGVLLFELLAGSRPYRLKRNSRAALEEAILVAEAIRPSDAAADPGLRRLLRGDLDTIVLKALKKPVVERYASVDALIDDIERHLSSRPVLARPDSAVYRSRKFIVRNRIAVGTAAALLLTVCVGAGAALWQAQIAIAERQRAESVKDFVAAIFREANPYEGSGTKDLTAVDLLKQADKKLAGAPIAHDGARVELTNVIGASLLALGDVSAAEPVVTRAVLEAEQTLAPTHPQTVRAIYLRSQVHRMRGRPQDASEDVDRILPTLRARIGVRTGVGTGALDLVSALVHRVGIALDLGAYADAERFAQEGFAVAESQLGEREPERVASAMVLAQSYRYTRKFDLALVSAERAYRQAITVWGESPPNRRMTEARSIYARALADTGDLNRGIAMLEASVADSRAVLGAKSQTAGIFLQNLVAYRMDVGELESADANAAEALEILGSFMPHDAPAYAIAEHSRAAVHLGMRKTSAALSGATRAAKTLDRTLGPSHENAIAARTTMALALMVDGRLDEAAREIDTVMAHATTLAPGSTQAARLAFARGSLARQRRDHQGALAHLRPLVESTEPSPKWQRERMRAWTQIGLVQIDQGAPAEAVASFEHALKEFARLEPGATPARADAQRGLDRAQLALARAPERPSK